MILYRYITKELPRPFFYSILTIVMIFMMMVAMRLLPRVLHRGIPAEIILQLFMLKMVAYFALAIPLALLVSSLMVFGRLSGDNEFTAIKAAGIGLSQLLPPVIAFSGVVTTMLIFFNSSILPETNVRGQQLYHDIMRTQPAAMIQSGVLMKEFKGYAMMVDSVDHGRGKLFGITIFADEKDHTPSVTVADSGTLFLTDDEEYLELSLYSGETVSDGGKNSSVNVYQIAFQKQVIYFDNPAKSFEKKDAKKKPRNDREMTTKQLLADIEIQKKQKEEQVGLHQKRLEELLFFYDSLRAPPVENSAKEVDSLSDSLDVLVVTTFPEWCARIKSPKTWQKTVREYIRREHHVARIRESRIKRSELKENSNLVEVHKKYALAFSAIVFAVLGVAFGIVGRSGSIAVSIIYAAVVYIVNYVFLIGGESLANRGVLSAEVAMWSGDVLLGLLAVYLIYISSREGSFVNLRTIYYYTLCPLFSPFLWLYKKVKRQRNSNRRPLLEPIVEFPRKMLHAVVPTMQAYVLGRLFVFFVVLIFSLVLLVSVLDYVGNLSHYRGSMFREIVVYYQHFTIAYLPMILHIEILLEVMMTIGSFAKTQEMTAIKASGVSVIRVTLPFLVFGIFISLFNFWFNEKMVVQSNVKMELMQDVFSARRNNRPIPTEVKSYRRNFYYFSGTSDVYRFGHFQTDPPRADRVQHYIFKDHRLKSVVEAERMVYDKGWTLTKGVERSWVGADIISKPFEERIDTVLKQTPKEMVKTVKMVEQMSYSELSNFMTLAKQRGESVERYRADLAFKISLPLMNLVVILIGVAVTARAGKRGGAVNFGGGILLVFFYWGSSQFLLLFGRGGTINPMVAAWGATVFFLLLGGTMYTRASR